MKKLLILALALAANLASAQSYRHSPVTPLSQAYRDHHSHPGYRPLPAPGFGWLHSAPAGYWTTHYDTVYVPGAYVTMLNAYGQPQLVLVPAHYETVSRQVWVARGW